MLNFGSATTRTLKIFNFSLRLPLTCDDRSETGLKTFSILIRSAPAVACCCPATACLWYLDVMVSCGFQTDLIL